MHGWGGVLILRFWSTSSDWERLHHCARGRGCSFFVLWSIQPQCWIWAQQRKRLRPKLLGLFQLKWDQEASVLAAGMKGNMLLVTQTRTGPVFSHRVVLYYDRSITFFIFLGTWMSPERWPLRDTRCPNQIKANLVLGRQDRRCPGGWCGMALTWTARVCGKASARLKGGVARSHIYLPFALHFFFLSFGVFASFFRVPQMDEANFCIWNETSVCRLCLNP